MANDPTPIRGGTLASPGRMHQKWYHLFLRIMALFDTVVAVRKARAKFGTEKFERLFRTTAELLDAELLDVFSTTQPTTPFIEFCQGR